MPETEPKPLHLEELIIRNSNNLTTDVSVTVSRPANEDPGYVPDRRTTAINPVEFAECTRAELVEFLRRNRDREDIDLLEAFAFMNGVRDRNIEVVRPKVGL
jgi:hypothetical protein